MLKKIWNTASTILVWFVVAMAVLLVALRVMGFQVYNVISGSMEPTYSVGDLLYVKQVDPDVVKVGDPITFVLNENLVVATHRVIRVDAENRYFYTQGDANETPDAAPVHFNNLVGIPKFSIPKLGYVSDFVQNPPGVYIALGVGLVLIALLFLPDILFKKAEAPASEKEKEKAEESRHEE
ncbi:MAG: signal peptidase I [Oscillospiraceae bacterium]|nr:signal peptidase I [Oscillospiraceae bacterium]